MTDELTLGFMASGTGSNIQAIVDACRGGRLRAQPGVVISNNSASGALDRARRDGIPCHHLSAKTHPVPDVLDSAILHALERHDVTLVVLAGYMKLLGSRTVSRYRARILNIHPALLPRYGGRGFYGAAVHEAVLAGGDKTTGVTVHLVDERYDRGPIVSQAEVPVLDGDTPDILGRRVLEREHQLYVETLRRIASGEIDLDEVQRLRAG